MKKVQILVTKQQRIPVLFLCYKNKRTKKGYIVKSITLIHLFIWQIFIECLLDLRHHTRFWEYVLVWSVSVSCPTLWDPMDHRTPGCSVHGIPQTRILEWVATSFSKGSSWPRDQTHISCIGRWIIFNWATREA